MRCLPPPPAPQRRPGHARPGLRHARRRRQGPCGQGAARHHCARARRGRGRPASLRAAAPGPARARGQRRARRARQPRLQERAQHGARAGRVRREGALEGAAAADARVARADGWAACSLSPPLLLPLLLLGWPARLRARAALGRGALHHGCSCPPLSHPPAGPGDLDRPGAEAGGGCRHHRLPQRRCAVPAAPPWPPAPLPRAAPGRWPARRCRCRCRCLRPRSSLPAGRKAPSLLLTPRCSCHCCSCCSEPACAPPVPPHLPHRRRRRPPQQASRRC